MSATPAVATTSSPVLTMNLRRSVIASPRPCNAPMLAIFYGPVPGLPSAWNFVNEAGAFLAAGVSVDHRLSLRLNPEDRRAG